MRSSNGRSISTYPPLSLRCSTRYDCTSVWCGSDSKEADSLKNVRPTPALPVHHSARDQSAACMAACRVWAIGLWTDDLDSDQLTILEAQDCRELRRAAVVGPGLDMDRAADVGRAVRAAHLLRNIFLRRGGRLTARATYLVAAHRSIDELGATTESIVGCQPHSRRRRFRTGVSNTRVHATTGLRNSPSSVRCRRAIHVQRQPFDDESW